MGSFRPLPTKCWESYLTLHGLSPVRIKGSHFQWTKKGLLRPIPVWGDEKEIPDIERIPALFSSESDAYFNDNGKVEYNLRLFDDDLPELEFEEEVEIL
jgi:hypothetical protein